jgi:hypothetical protein
LAAPAFQRVAGGQHVPVKQANSRGTCGSAPVHWLPLQSRKANFTALHDGGLTLAAIAQSMRGDIRFAPEDSTITDRVIGRLRRGVQGC